MVPVKDLVLILDFGSQFTQLITRRVRELGLYSEIVPCHTKPEALKDRNIQALILSGGPASVTDSDAPEFDKRWLEQEIPTLGVCYGMQLISLAYGATLGQGKSREYGKSILKIEDNTGLFKSFKRGEETQVWMSHGDHVESVPKGFTLLGSSKGSPVAAIADFNRKICAIQFHPEVAHTVRGKDILSSFLFEIAGLKPNWSSVGFIEETVERIRAEVPPGTSVVCGLSGGVDSTVAAKLVHRAIGDRQHCIIVDNGLLRKNEGAQILKRLGPEGLGLNAKLVDASEKFLSELSGISDPEQKRKIIGRVFIEVFEEEAKKIPNVTHLVQGTLYPDVIESVSVKGPSATIKSHHNVGGLPERMHLKLIEPLRELFKDEVRAFGAELEIPRELLQRQPFPGPGLAVRVVGEINKQRLELLREADAIFVEEVRQAGLYTSIWQSFAVILPVWSVGVMGDFRTYEETIVLRAVSSQDGMTADWVYLPEDLLRRVSSRIINEVRGINRVVLDISSKPPSTIEWE